MDFQSSLLVFDQAVALVPNLVRKGKSMPYTGDNQRMFGMVNKTGEIGVRLSKEDQEHFAIEFPEHAVYESYGAVMKDDVHLPESFHSNPSLIADYLQKSWSYIQSLPSKPKKK